MMRELKEVDPEIFSVVKNELHRQRDGVELIASENYVSKAVMQAMGSVLTNKYSEGYPGKRYYGGNEHVDVSEQLAIDRVKKLFGSEHANVQPHAGSQANMAAYFAMLEPGDKVLGMDLSHGGHLTHGSPVNFSGKLYKFVSYGVDPVTKLIDIDEVRKIALKEKPKLLLSGFSAYPRKLDFKAFKEIADEIGAYHMADIAHIAGIIAAGLHQNPVPHCDIVTSTTHKTLRGPRGAIILSRADDRLHPSDKKNLAGKIDSAVFPGMQGGPLDHVIAAKAVAFGEALQPSFVDYQRQVLKNAKALAETLMSNGIELVSGGTDNHLMLIDLTKLGLGGKEVEKALDEVGIFTNKNMIPFDTRSPFNPSGIRLGSPALTTRGFKEEEEMGMVGEFISCVICDINDSQMKARIKGEVLDLCKRFPIYAGLVQ
jgi:glycine hydroxymethyltransferase